MKALQRSLFYVADGFTLLTLTMENKYIFHFAKDYFC